MRLNPISGHAPGLPADRLYEIRDHLLLALDSTESKSGYPQHVREARSYVRTALRHTLKLMEMSQ